MGRCTYFRGCSVTLAKINYPLLNSLTKHRDKLCGDIRVFTVDFNTLTQAVSK